MDRIGSVSSNYTVPNKTVVKKAGAQKTALPQDKVTSGSSTQSEAVDSGKLAKLKQAVSKAGEKAGKAGEAIKSGLLVASSIALTIGCVGMYAGHGILKLADKVNNIGKKYGGEKLGKAMSNVTGDNAMTKVTGNALASGGVAAAVGAGAALLLGGPIGAAALTAGAVTFGAGFLGGAYGAAEKSA